MRKGKRKEREIRTDGEEVGRGGSRRQCMKEPGLPAPLTWELSALGRAGRAPHLPGPGLPGLPRVGGDERKGPEEAGFARSAFDLPGPQAAEGPARSRPPPWLVRGDGVQGGGLAGWGQGASPVPMLAPARGSVGPLLLVLAGSAPRNTHDTRRGLLTRPVCSSRLVWRRTGYPCSRGSVRARWLRPSS